MEKKNSDCILRKEIFFVMMGFGLEIGLRLKNSQCACTKRKSATIIMFSATYMYTLLSIYQYN